MKRISKKSVMAGALIGALLGITITAVAFWTSTGNGSGSATTGTDSNYLVTATNANLADLTPGGPSDTIAYHVKNQSTGHQSVTQVVISVANSDGTAWDGPGTCSKDDFSVGGAAAGASFTDLTGYPDNLAGGATHDDTVTIQLADTGVNQNDCRSVTVPLYFAAT